jgi:hypothetical protein
VQELLDLEDMASEDDVIAVLEQYKVMHFPSKPLQVTAEALLAERFPDGLPSAQAPTVRRTYLDHASCGVLGAFGTTPWAKDTGPS